MPSGVCLNVYRNDVSYVRVSRSFTTLLQAWQDAERLDGEQRSLKGAEQVVLFSNQGLSA